MKRIALVILAAAAVGGCSTATGATNADSGSSNADTCIVLALGGNKLCGGDAAAWCSSTDYLRTDLQPGDPNYDSKQTCKDIEQANGY